MSDCSTDLIPPEWLARHLEDGAVRVIDCRFSLAEPELGRRQYAEAHIPGAVHADLERDLSGATGPRTGRHPLPDPEAFARRLEAWGIDSEDTGAPTLVVAYDDAKLMFAARLWWMLRYVGHRHAAVLDGGWSAWKRLGLPTGTEVPRPPSGRFTPHPRAEMVAGYQEVRAALGDADVELVDSRSPARHQGLAEPIDPVAGTIPGSSNYFSEAVVDASGRMRSPTWLAEHWRALDRVPRTIAFCGSGVAACVNLLSQKVAGREPSTLYVGGWSEWCRREKNDRN
jgi:thiosulfate/3-mercaptopyruvate sulfurtransferase